MYFISLSFTKQHRHSRTVRVYVLCKQWAFVWIVNKSKYLLINMDVCLCILDSGELFTLAHENFYREYSMHAHIVWSGKKSRKKFVSLLDTIEQSTHTAAHAAAVASRVVCEYSSFDIIKYTIKRHTWNLIEWIKNEFWYLSTYLLSTHICRRRIYR